MLEKAIEILKIFESNGYTAYIVGGFVRDYILGRNSTDIDICTSATPKDIINLFNVKNIPINTYGSVVVVYKKCFFDITTLRKDIKYENNRKPIKIKYINSLKKDLLRRDFTMNTLCIDSNNNVIDLLHVRCDIDNHIIKTVGNPRYRIKEDSLRILRAIRFSTILDFKIDDKTMIYLKKYGYLLKNLSYNRKKEELDKIFSSSNREKGIRLILDLGLDKYLDISKLKDVIVCDNIVGIWSQLDVDNLYPFTKLEKLQMNKVRELVKLDLLDKYNVYKYGLYISTICADIKGIDKKEINVIRENFPILSKSDIKIHPIEIASILNIKPSSYLKNIMDNLEKDIIYGNVINEYEEIVRYIKEKYSE